MEKGWSDRMANWRERGKTRTKGDKAAKLGMTRLYQESLHAPWEQGGEVNQATGIRGRERPIRNSRNLKRRRGEKGRLLQAARVPFGPQTGGRRSVTVLEKVGEKPEQI